ncbi:cyclin-dependent kinase inhibitor far1 [Mortierella sp. AD094]|nr:cyclin-dependent kinase inhibitor far1 [Mortierella sp. AD094]
MHFYKHNNVIFLTDGTGFVGKTLLEKILRSLPQVKRVYVLMRASPNSLKSRVGKEIFEDRVFDTLRAQFSDDKKRFRDEVTRKVVAVQGDIGQNRLGISDNDWKMIQADTSVVLNCAASDNLVGPLRYSLSVNTNGALQVFELAKGMPRLKSIAHVSSAYVNAHMVDTQVKEDIYAFPIGDPEQIYEQLSKMSKDEMALYEKDAVLKTYPNTSFFTKSLTEQLIQNRYYTMNLPIMIVRPSTICAAVQEPVPGWSQAGSPIVDATVSCALGIVQEWVADENKILDMIPVDVLCKTLLMAAVAIAAGPPSQMLSTPIIQTTTSAYSPLFCGDFFSSSKKYWQTVPAPRGRVSNDIRTDLYSMSEFPLRIQQRLSKEIVMVGSRNGEKYRKIISTATVLPEMLASVCWSEQIFLADNAIALDHLTPKELHSGL